MKRVIPWLAAVALVFGAAGCKREKKSSPKYWVKKLSGNNWQEALRQLERMANTPGEKGAAAKEAALQPLLDLYDRNNDPTVLGVLVGFKDKRVVPALDKALGAVSETSTQSMEAGKVAARALAVFGVADAPGAEANLIKLAQMTTPIQTPSDTGGRASINVVRNEAIKALAAYPSAASTDALAGLLAKSPDEVNIFLQGEACQSISAHPDATRVLAQLIRGLFLAHKIDPIGSYPQCRLALARVGQGAVPTLIELLNEKYAPINEMAKKENWQADETGVIIIKAAGLLADLRATQSSDAVLAQFRKEIARGANARDSVYGELVRTLGIIGDDKAADALLAEGTASKLEHMRPAAANFYSTIGVRKGFAPLLAVASTGDSPAWRAAGAIAAGRIAMGKGDQSAIEAAMKSMKADDPTKEVLEQSLDRAKTAVECEKKPECYAAKLANDNPAVVEKAVFELGFLGDKAMPVLDQLLDAAGNDSDIVRSPAQISLTRVAPGACPQCVTKLEEMIKKLESSSARTTKTMELKVLLNLYLGRAAAGSAQK